MFLKYNMLLLTFEVVVFKLKMNCEQKCKQCIILATLMWVDEHGYKCWLEINNKAVKC